MKSFGCNQGRDCPVRVAKVGRRTPAAKPLPPSFWRAYLRHLAKWMLISVSVLTACAVFVGAMR